MTIRFADIDDVTSKSSILAKHLLFDTTLSAAFDLRTESGRRNFLADCCYVVVVSTNIEEAVRAEKRLMINPVRLSSPLPA
jgi:hypothetical protein